VVANIFLVVGIHKSSRLIGVLQEADSILCVLTWNSAYTHGVAPNKTPLKVPILEENEFSMSLHPRRPGQFTEEQKPYCGITCSFQDSMAHPSISTSL